MLQFSPVCNIWMSVSYPEVLLQFCQTGVEIKKSTSCWTLFPNVQCWNIICFLKSYLHCIGVSKDIYKYIVFLCLITNTAGTIPNLNKVRGKFGFKGSHRCDLSVFPHYSGFNFFQIYQSFCFLQLFYCGCDSKKNQPLTTVYFQSRCKWFFLFQ